MPGRGQIAFARRHAQTVEQVETCAPAVEGGYLDRALARMRLPISAFWSDDMQKFVIYGRELRDGLCDAFFAKTERDAYVAYLGLATLLATNPPSDSPPPPAHPTPRVSSSLSGDTAAAGRAASSDTPSELA